MKAKGVITHQVDAVVIRLTLGQIAAIKWLKQCNRLWIPHTINGLEEWEKHKPASMPSFYALKNKGLARTDPKYPQCWELTEEGVKISDNYV